MPQKKAWTVDRRRHPPSPSERGMTTSTPGRIEGIEAIRTFILSSEGPGRTLFTLRNTKRDTHLTFRVRRKKQGAALPKHRPWFVTVLTGPNNESDYEYVGCIWPQPNGDLRFSTTVGSTFPPSDTRAKAAAFLVACLQKGLPLPPALEVWHHARCGRCGRTLTTPESLITGIGPKCARIKRGAS